MAAFAGGSTSCLNYLLITSINLKKGLLYKSGSILKKQLKAKKRTNGLNNKQTDFTKDYRDVYRCRGANKWLNMWTHKDKEGRFSYGTF